MLKIASYGLVIMLLLGRVAMGQTIVYSEPDRDDSRRMDFEIVGKLNDNFIIYKNTHNRSYISLYNEEMVQVEKVEQDYIPDERLINTDFFPYATHFFMVYQYQRRNVVYCVAARIGPDGKKIGEPILMDTTHLGFTANNKIYTVKSSEDRNKILIFKVNSHDRTNYVMTTMLFNRDLVLQHKSVLNIPMDRSDEFLGEFQVDNDGDMVFTKVKRDRNENIRTANFLYKEAEVDSLEYYPLSLQDIYLDDIVVKVDNNHKRYYFTSFYYQQHRGNIEGLYLNVWGKSQHRNLLEKQLEFGDNLREEARSSGGIRSAFNDFFIRDVIIKRDGGFLLNTESYYTTSRYNDWNRWNYMYGSPYYGSYNYYYSPYSYYNSWYWQGDRYNNSSVRYHADNIVILSFDSTGNLSWNNVIKKGQFDDETGGLVSYLMVNTGSRLHYLFNNLEKRALLLTDISLAPGGDINRNPTLRNLDKGYDFLAKFGKQVSYNQSIIPCFYRNYICFAKLEYN